jgi:peptide/nickel transport system permease protein
MLRYIFRRVLWMLVTLFAVSVISFILIQLPPGDAVTSQLKKMQEAGEGEVSREKIEAFRAMYHLDDPMPVQYLRWIANFLRGDMGYSTTFEQPVNDLIWERVGLTVTLSLAGILFTWVLAVPIGIYSAVRQYSVTDYVVTVAVLIGMAVPEFVLALVLMFLGYKYFGISIGGLFSPELADAPWSLVKVGDLLRHLWVPTIVLAVGGTAGLIRVLRANLLDELKKPYVVTARAKGLRPFRLILKYPVRLAINPFMSTIGWMLPGLLSSSVILSVVLALPTMGPLQLESLLGQDMYLAGSLVLIFSTLTVIGTLISDIMLALSDPRIKYE